MRVLLVGGSGLLGEDAANAFVRAGHEVTIVARGQRRPVAGARMLVADRGDAAALAGVLSGERFDFTVDFLAYDAEGVARLFAVPGLELGRAVMISTGQVYLVAHDKTPPFDEAAAARPAIDEPEQGTRAHGNWVYGVGKRAAEASFARFAGERGIPSLALRIPTVQGEGDGRVTGRLWAWLERMRDGGPLLLQDGGEHRLRFVYSRDVARALVRLAEAATWPKVAALNLAQPDELTLREFLEEVARAAGLSPRFVAIASERLAEAELVDAVPYTGTWWSRPDPTLALRELGFQTSSPREFLPSVVAAHLASPPPSHESYALRARELALVTPGR